MFVYSAVYGRTQLIPALQYVDHPVLMLSLVMARFAFAVSLVLVIPLRTYTFVEAPARRWLRALWPEKQGLSAWGLAVAALPAMIAIIIMVSSQATPARTFGSGIQVISATYGANCSATKGNASSFITKACNGHNFCDYVVRVATVDDPAPDCSKSFAAEFVCAPSAQLLREEIPADLGDVGLGRPFAWKREPRSRNLRATVADAARRSHRTGLILHSH
jgi:hypothetical protein